MYPEFGIDVSEHDSPEIECHPMRGLARLAPVHLSGKLPNHQINQLETQINAQCVHVWPFDVFSPVAVFFLTDEDRSQVRMNRHEYFEVFYLCSGSADFYIQNNILPLRPGDFAFVGSNHYHTVRSGPSGAKIAVLFFRPDLIRCDGCSDSAEYLTPFLIQDSAFPHTVAVETGVPLQMFGLMQQIGSRLPALSPSARLVVNTLLKSLLILLLNHFASYGETKKLSESLKRDMDRLGPLFLYLRDNYASKVHVRTVARMCGMSESYFMSFFKRLIGRPFTDYLNRYRIERALGPLVSAEESIADISDRLGFCDRSQFGVAFRRIVGMTPANYRRSFGHEGAFWRSPANHASARQTLKS